jgi:hypothetical protein
MPIEKADVELTEHRVGGEDDVQSESWQQQQIGRRHPAGTLRAARALRGSAQRTCRWALLDCRSCGQGLLAVKAS